MVHSLCYADVRTNLDSKLEEAQSSLDLHYLPRAPRAIQAMHKSCQAVTCQTESISADLQPRPTGSKGMQNGYTSHQAARLAAKGATVSNYHRTAAATSMQLPGSFCATCVTDQAQWAVRCTKSQFVQDSATVIAPRGAT